MKPRSNIRLWTLIVGIILCFIFAFSLWGVELVPFHPDESTNLYLSADLKTFFQNPASMAWSPEQEGDLKQHYRALDAPLTRYLLGVGLLLSGREPLSTDWNWSKTWEENQTAGALPNQDLLRVGRITMTLLIPFSLWLIYLIGSAMGGRSTGLLAMLFLGFNALILLHNRRAMAESVLIFGVLLALWTFTKAERHPWLAGLAMAVAFNAKHSTLALLPVGLLAVCWNTEVAKPGLRKILFAVTQYCLVFCLVTLTLNPYVWRYPSSAAKAMWSGRQKLLAAQTEDIARYAPEQVLVTPGKRAAVLIANTYITSPAFADVGNYLEQTAAAEQAYMAVLGHNLLRGILAGGLMLVLSITGLFIGLLQSINPSIVKQNKTLLLVLLGTIFQFLALSATIHLPWQRYSMPLIPYACIWPAYTIGYFLNQMIKSAVGEVSPAV